ncbi:UNVERIFIED_CONTAM: hypothetical protein FKN15_066489 [Acipenser sinensis]
MRRDKRTSDGTNAVGSIVVSQLKMGEIEDGEVDQIATDAQGQKQGVMWRKKQIQELKELGDLSPHWDNLRKDVINHCRQIISSYQETLTEINKLTGSSFKPSISKAEKYLEFIPINLHTQRMRVNCPRKTDAAYDVVTVGAPAAHFQGFKNGGLHRLLSRFEAEKKNDSTRNQVIQLDSLLKRRDSTPCSKDVTRLPAQKT